jgi:hypothetical protein
MLSVSLVVDSTMLRSNLLPDPLQGRRCRHHPRVLQRIPTAGFQVHPTTFAKPESTPAAGELDAYLNMDIYAFAWWKWQRSTYPRLSCVALDFLTIPGTSVAQHPYVFTVPKLALTSLSASVLSNRSPPPNHAG